MNRQVPNPNQLFVAKLLVRAQTVREVWHVVTYLNGNTGKDWFATSNILTSEILQLDHQSRG